VNSWNYTEYIAVVPRYLIKSYVYISTMTDTTSGQDHLLIAILTERTSSLANYFVEFVMNLLVPTVLPAF